MTRFLDYKALYLFFFILILQLVFAPSFLLFSTCFFLLAISQYTQISNQQLFVLTVTCIFFNFFGFTINSTSLILFQYEEQDFTSYYNNYLHFVNGEFNKGLTEFFVEIGLPVLNLIISFLINEKNPYLLIFIYSSIHYFLFILLTYKVANREGFQLDRWILLFVLFIIFSKSGTLLNHLRQSFACFFILFAMLHPRKINIYFIIATLFHISTIIIYPLILYIHNNKKFSRIRFVIANLCLCLLILFFIDFISDYVLSDYSFISMKLHFILSNINDISFAWPYIKNSIVASMYFILLFIFIFHLKSSNEVFKIIVFLLVYSLFLGLNIRLLEPVLAVFMGYYFYKNYNSSKYIKFTIIFMLVFFQYRWMFINQSFYERFPMYSSNALYYLEEYNIEYDYIDRSALPKKRDADIRNVNKN